MTHSISRFTRMAKRRLKTNSCEEEEFHFLLSRSSHLLNRWILESTFFLPAKKILRLRSPHSKPASLAIYKTFLGIIVRSISFLQNKQEDTLKVNTEKKCIFWCRTDIAIFVIACAKNIGNRLMTRLHCSSGTLYMKPALRPTAERREKAVKTCLSSKELFYFE